MICKGSLIKIYQIPWQKVGPASQGRPAVEKKKVQRGQESSRQSLSLIVGYVIPNFAFLSFFFIFKKILQHVLIVFK